MICRTALILHMGVAGTRSRKRDAASARSKSVLHAHTGRDDFRGKHRSEMATPYLRRFGRNAAYGLRFNLISARNLLNCRKKNASKKGFAPCRAGSRDLHDNHGDKDEHLPPYEDHRWPAAIKLLKSAKNRFAAVLELKDKNRPDARALQNNSPPPEKPWTA